MPKKADGYKPVKSYKHPASKRKNLPTEQNEPFMEDEQKASVVYRPPIRHAGSIPRLSWDRAQSLDSLEALAYPLYIHEKIHPSNFVNSLLVDANTGQTGLWEQFNGLPKKAAYEWYQHQGNWQNRIIRGESTRVMASLLAKEGMAGQVQMVYYDPPYGISFNSNFQASTRSREVGSGEKGLPNDQATIQAFRDTYVNGIHSYLDNIYRNVTFARELLTDTGSMFLQIGPENVHRLAVMMDEIFGSENRVSTISFTKTGGTSSAKLPSVADFILWYAKDKGKCKYHQLYEPLSRQEVLEHMNWHAFVELPDGTTRQLSNSEKRDVTLLPKGAKLFKRVALDSMHESKSGRSDDYVYNGQRFKCPHNRQWSVSKEGMDRLAQLGRFDVTSQGGLRWKRYEYEYPGRRITNIWREMMSASDLHYVVETAEKVIQRCILMTTDPGDLVFDPTCGSGTTAFVAEKWGRRWITTDTSGVAVSLARQRVATGVFKYFLLRDSLAGSMKEAELSKQSDPGPTNKYENDLSKGFVYQRTPRVTTATLAYELDETPIMIVDQPFEKPSTIRVSSSFTVESESPYRYISPQMTRFQTSHHMLDQIAAIKSALEHAGICIRGGTNSFQRN